MKFDDNGNLLIYKNEVIQIFSCALKKLFENDMALFTYDVQERAIAIRLGMYLREYLLFAEAGGVMIDLEYNRDGANPKRPHDHMEGDGRWISPDIILHQRGSSNCHYKNDIFFCEIKKSSDDDNDAKRVKEQIKDKNYKYGINLYKLSATEVKLDFYLFATEERIDIIRKQYHYDFDLNMLIE